MGDSRMSQAFYDEAVKVNATHSRAPNNCLANSNSNIGIRGASKCRRDKSPSDLEADDENDHDSLNQSETGSTLSLSGTTPTSSGATPTLTTVTSPTEQQKVTRTASLTNSNTP